MTSSQEIGYENENGLEIAIIGMAGRFPGAANLAEFWENLKNGVEAISFYSGEELADAGISSELIDNANYVKADGALEGKDCFDAAFFGITPKEAETMDPQLRLFLECSWEALEDAGYAPGTYEGSVGVYGGPGDDFNWRALEILTRVNSGAPTFDSPLSSNGSMLLSTYISHKLDLKGPSITLFTGCSTSMVALHLACRGLLMGECDMALAGGVRIGNHSKSGYLYNEGMIVSPDGHCRTFDNKARGTVFGEGVGIVVLKRLREALQDRDNILAVIKGTAINNDGADKASYTAPSQKQITEAIRSALSIARVEPETIGYVEAHGTATSLGDGIEWKALAGAFSSHTSPGKNRCRIGSVKPNIGHLETAAGISGLIKTIFALKYQIIPPTLHFEAPNPELDLEASPFDVNTTLTGWEDQGHPLRAAVNSLGIGGTNANVVLEEPPVIDHRSFDTGKKRDYQLIVLSAKSPSALDKMTENLLEHFTHHHNFNLADAAYTLQTGRQNFQHRRMTVCADIHEAIRILSSSDPTNVKTFQTKKDEPPIIFMFPGQGAQYVNMGKGIYDTEPVFRKTMDRCFEILNSLLDYDLKEILYPGNLENLMKGSSSDESVGSASPGDSAFKEGNPDPKEEVFNINQTEIAQPAIFILEYALAKMLMQWGIKPSAMIGHSIGEFTAACLAGVFTLEDALHLVVSRGQLMQQMPQGAMLSVPLDEKTLTPMLNEDLSIAAVNTPSSCVVSGTTQAINSLVELLKEKKYEPRFLHTSHAFHSKMMDPILKEFERKVEEIKLNQPGIPYISNLTGEWAAVSDVTHPGYWARHLRKTVRFYEGLKELLKKEEAIFVEVGPGKILSTFVRQHEGRKPGHMAVDLIRHPGEKVPDDYYLLTKIGQLWLYGQRIDWRAFHNGEKRYRQSLPTYPFERKRFKVEGDPFILGAHMLAKGAGLEKNRDIGNWFYTPTWRLSRLPVLPEGEHQATGCLRWLFFMDNRGLGAKLVKQLEAKGQEVIMVKTGTLFSQVGEREYTLNPTESDGYEKLFRHLTTRERIPPRIVHLWNVTGTSETSETSGTTGTKPNQSAAEALDSILETGYYSLLHIAQSLGRLNITDEIQIYVVSDNMQCVKGEEKVVPEKATLLGPVKGIPKEYGNIRLRSIDIHLSELGTGEESKLPAQLTREFYSKSQEPVIAYRENHRWVEIYEPIYLEASPGKKSRLRKGGVYLVIGGLGGIGFELAGHLAKQVQAKLVLVGRTGIPSRELYQEWLNTHTEDDNTSKKIKRIRHLEEIGAEVMVSRADAADFEQMQEVIEQVKKRYGAINGVLHCAVVPDGAMIQVRDREASEKVFMPKVRGTLVLDRLLKDVPLDFFILCSSMDSIITAPGQVGYCAANLFMNAYAQYKANTGGPFTVSVYWPRWQSIGIALIMERLHEKLIGERLTGGITAADGVEVLTRILADEQARVLVEPQDLRTLVQRDYTSRLKDFMQDFEKISAAEDLYPRPQLTTPYVAPRDECEQTVAEVWRDLFGFEAIGVYDDFFEIGGDSLKIIAAVSKIQRKIGVEIPVTEFFNKPNIEAIAKYIRQQDTKKRRDFNV